MVNFFPLSLTIPISKNVDRRRFLQLHAELQASPLIQYNLEHSNPQLLRLVQIRTLLISLYIKQDDLLKNWSFSVEVINLCINLTFVSFNKTTNACTSNSPRFLVPVSPYHYLNYGSFCAQYNDGDAPKSLWYLFLPAPNGAVWFLSMQGSPSFLKRDPNQNWSS